MTRSLLIVLALCAGCRRQPTPTPPVTPREVPKREPKPITLSPDVALSMIEARYVGGLQRCYRARLKRDPSARGKIVLTFTVSDDGTLAYRRARGVARSLEKCVESAMLRWSFPPARNEATFRIALSLDAV